MESFIRKQCISILDTSLWIFTDSIFPILGSCLDHRIKGNAEARTKWAPEACPGQLNPGLHTYTVVRLQWELKKVQRQTRGVNSGLLGRVYTGCRSLSQCRGRSVVSCRRDVFAFTLHTTYSRTISLQ